MKKLILPALFLMLFTCSLLQVNLVAKAPTETAVTAESVVSPEATPVVEPTAIVEQQPPETDSGVPETVVRGRVFMPDGSPAKNRYISVQYQNPTKNSVRLSGTHTNEQGGYLHDVPVGVPMLAMVKNREHSSQWLEDGLASPIISTYVKESHAEGEYDIHLQKGIHVGGTLRYEDGTPAVNKTVMINVYGFGGESFTLPEKDSLGRDNFFRPYLYQHVYSDENGNYTFWLLPDGVYEIEQEDMLGDKRRQPLELAADETERTIDFTLPQPTVLHFVLLDGTPVSDAEIYICSRMGEHQNRRIVKLQPEQDDKFRVVLSPTANLISVKTPDGKFGANQFVEGEERLNPITITLLPAAAAKVRLINTTTDQPIVGKKLACIPSLRIHDNLLLLNGEMLEQVQTDENGVATMTNIYVGDAEYHLYDGYSEAEDKLRMDFAPPKNPGTTVDLGDIRIKDESPEQKPPVAELDPETAKLVQLAESMVTLPNVTAEQLRDVANDLSQSEPMKQTDEKVREPINRTLIKVYNKIIALKPDADVLGDIYWSKYHVLSDLIRVRYANEEIAALEKFAEETDDAGNSRIAWVRREAKSWAKQTRIWQLERRENPTLKQFLAIRKETVDFLKNNATSNSYPAGTLVRVAEKFWTVGLLTQDQMYETYLMAIDALENRENSEAKSELEAKLALMQVEGKTPAITGTDRNGQPFDSNALRGKTVLMTFTSSWYGGHEMGDMLRLAEAFSGHELEFVTYVALNENDAQEQQWLNLCVEQLDYPGTVLTKIESREPAIQGIVRQIEQRNYGPVHGRRQFLLIDQNGQIAKLAQTDEMLAKLTERFGKPSDEAIERGLELSKRCSATPKTCFSNLLDLALAVHYYYDAHKKMPPAYTIDEKGNKLHSWRVLLLPYLGYEELYSQIRLDEPWDSEYNKQFQKIIVPVFQCHLTAFGPNPQPVTNYAAIVGRESAFEENGKQIGFIDIADGMSNTMLFVERATPVNWMDPTDITFEEAVKGVGVSENGIADAHNGGCNCAFCDGATHFLPKDIDSKLLRAILTRASGEGLQVNASGEWVSFPE